MSVLLSLDFAPGLIEDVYARRGWRTYSGVYDLNLFGIRVGRVNSWADVIGCLYTSEAGRRVLECWDATTIPGRPGLVATQPNPEGVAILPTGFYPSLWMRGSHKGRYSCLTQAGPVTVVRDGDKDGALDLDGRRQTGMFGIQLHHGDGAPVVGPYSLGCQATHWPEDLYRLLSLLGMQERHGHGSRLSYGLMDEADLAL